MLVKAKGRPVVTDGLSGSSVQHGSANNESHTRSPSKKQCKRRRKAPIAVVRTAQVRRALEFLHGPVLPDDDSGRRKLFAYIQVRAPKGEGELYLRRVIATVAPWMSYHEAARLLDSVFDRPIHYRADTLGRIIGLPDRYRTHLRITSFGAADISREERIARTKTLKAAQLMAKRRAKGVKPRADYLATSVQRAQPWRAVGMSRASWYRKGRPEPETGLTTRILFAYALGDTPVLLEQGGGASRQEVRASARMPLRKSEPVRREGIPVEGELSMELAA